MPLVLLLAVALFVGVPTVVLGELAADDTRHRVRDAELQSQRRTAERVVNSIRDTLTDVRSFLAYAAPARGRTTALAQAVERGDAAAVQAELTTLYRTAPYTITSLTAYDGRGTFTVAVFALNLGPGSGTRTSVRQDPQQVPLNRIRQVQLPPELRDELARSREAVAFGFRALDPMIATGGPDPTIALPPGRRLPIGIALAGSGPGPAGFLFVEVDLTFLVPSLLEAANGKGEIYVLDSEGRLLRRLTRATTDTGVGLDLSSSALVARLVAGERVEGEADDPLGQGAQIVVTRRTEPLVVGGGVELDLRWQVIAARPVALVYSDVDTALAQFRAVRLALLAILLGGAFVLGRSLQQIRSQQRLLERSSRHKSEFLANMSHELRTPLNAVIGFSDVLLQRIAGPISEKQAEYLGDIRASGRHLLALINDILDLSKIEAGRMELQLAEFSLPATLADALTMVRERASERGVALVINVALDVAIVTADERKLRQVVANLLSNAVKFTPSGGTVTVRAVRQTTEVRVAVQDTGVGIAPDDQARIFEEFEQATHGKEAAEGTGLGLTLAKRIIELHGGRIWVESEVGRGSTFTFALPLLPAGKEG